MSYSTIENCEHESIHDGCCENCGLYTGLRIDYDLEYTKNLKKSTESNTGDLKNVDFISEELRDIVSKNMMTQKISAKRRAQSMICEIYVSGSLTNEVQPEQVIKYLKLPKGVVKKSMRIISGTDTKIQQTNTVQIISISPFYCLREICTEIDSFKECNSDLKSGKNNVNKYVDILPHFENLKLLIENVIHYSPCIINNRPKNLTVGFIRYYCKLKKLTIRDINNVFGVSKAISEQIASKLKKLCIKYNIHVD